MSVIDELQDIVLDSDIPKLAMFMFEHKIPSAKVQFKCGVVIDMKIGVKNEHPSFSLEMYAESEVNND